MPEADVMPTGAEAPDTSAPDGGMTEDQAAESFLADIGTGASIADDPLAKAAAAEGIVPAKEPSPEPAAETPAEPAPEPEADAVLATGKPFSYGEGKALEWATHVPGEGVMIDEADVPKLTERMARAEQVEAAYTELAGHAQQVEAAGGIPRIAELTEQVAMLDAAGTRLLSFLKDPQAIYSLLTQQADGTIVVDPARVKDVLEKIESDTKLARYAAKEKLGDLFRQAGTQRTEQQQSAHRDTMRTKGFEQILAQAAQVIPGLTADDLEDARVAFGPNLASYERLPSAAEVQQYGFRADQPIIDPTKMEAFLRRRATQSSTRTTTQRTQAQVTAENSARLGATKNGTKNGTTRPANGRPGAGKAPPPTAKHKIAPDDDGSFDFIKRNAMVGRFATQDG